MRVKIVGFGHSVTDTRFKFEGTFAKDLKAGGVLGYHPDTMALVESPEIGHRVVMAVLIRWKIPNLPKCTRSPTTGPQRISNTPL
jgi:hypothetical protein